MNQVHIGMLSSKFIADSCSDYIVAPIVSFNLKNDSSGNQNLVPITPLSDKFLNLILGYT